MILSLSSGERYECRRSESFWRPSLWSHGLGFRLFDQGVEVMCSRKVKLTEQQSQRGLSERYRFLDHGEPVFSLNRLSAFSELGDFIEYRGQDYVLPCGLTFRLDPLDIDITSLSLWVGPSPVTSCNNDEHLPLAIGLTCFVALRQSLGEP